MDILLFDIRRMWKLHKKITATIILVVLLAMPIVIFLPNIMQIPTFIVQLIQLEKYTNLAQAMDQFIQKNIPLGKELQSLQRNVQRVMGAKEYNHIFINDGTLIENIQPPNEIFVTENSNHMITLSDKINIPTYLALIPTACAIKQESTPAFAPIFNQKVFIEDVYRRVSTNLATVDVYQALLQNKNRYLYYRTASNLTSHGGFAVYQAIANKMHLDVKQLDQFNMQTIDNTYYGPLYQQLPFSDIQADVISIFNFSRYARQYSVTHYNQKSMQTYYTLFPTFLKDINGIDKTDIFLGGISPATEIKILSPYQKSLLVFGDETAKAYLPFLSIHYSDILLIDLAQIDADYLSKIMFSDFDQILFAYSLDTFMHTDDLQKLAQIQ